MEGDEEPSFNEEQAPPQAAVFANGDNASRDRHDTSTSNASEEWKTKSANDLLVDLLDPVSDFFAELIARFQDPGTNSDDYSSE